MKKHLLLSTLLVALFSATFFSCKKDDNNGAKSRQELIVGTWNLDSFGLDSNKNDVLEPSEAKRLNSSEVAKLIFNADGSGVSRLAVGDSVEEEQFNWSVSADGKTLAIMQGLTFNNTIVTLTQNRLAYYFDENGDHYFEVFTR